MDSKCAIAVYLCIMLMSLTEVLGSCPIVQLNATSEERFFNSPNYPYEYDANMDCFWIIKARERSDVIKLKVVDSELEGSYTCSFNRDIVTVYDGNSTWSPKLGEFCGNEEPFFIGFGQYMYVHFHTDSSTNRKGFYILYRSGNRVYFRGNRSTDKLLDESYANFTVPVVGCFIGLSVLFIIFVVVIAVQRQKNDRRRTRTRSQQKRTEMTSVQNDATQQIHLAYHPHPGIDSPGIMISLPANEIPRQSLEEIRRGNYPSEPPPPYPGLPANVS